MNQFPALLSEFNQFSVYEAFFSPSFLTELAKRHGFIIRGRKLNAVAFAFLCCCLPEAGCYPSLDQMRGSLLYYWQISISKSALHERFTSSAVAFMRGLFQAILSQQLAESPMYSWSKSFSDVIVLDSTVINLAAKCEAFFRGFGGGGSPSSSKIQFNMGLLSGKIEEMSLLPGRKPDSGYRLTRIVPGALYLFDLGYLCAANLLTLIHEKAWFVVRYKYGTNIYHPDRTPIDSQTLDRLVRNMKVGTYWEKDILLGQKDLVPCRMVLHKLPPKVADEIRRKLKTDKQKKAKGLSKGRLAFCDVNAFLTNLSPLQLPATQMRETYAIRWQIEILFKTWKSAFQLDMTRDLGPWQFQCFLYGGLIRAIIAMRIFQQAKTISWTQKQIELSELKAMNLLAGMKTAFAKWLFLQSTTLEIIMTQILIIFESACVKETKKNKASPFQTIEKFP